MKEIQMLEPKEKYPRIWLGFAKGEWRWERHKDDREKDKPFDEYTPGGWKWQVDRSGEKWGPPTQQYKAKYGFSILVPFALNVWYQFRPQVEGKPGSEFVIYRRFSKWRWDPGGTLDKITWTLRHWIGPWSIYFNFSRHWD